MSNVDIYTTYQDARGNPPNLGLLSFPIPQGVQDFTDLTDIVIYLKEAGPVYTELLRQGIYGIDGYVEYWFPFLTAVHAEAYAVRWARADASLVPVTPVDAEVYFPPIPDPTRVHTNTATTVAEHVRRVFLVERQGAEKALLLKRKIRGVRCVCWNTRAKEALRDCGDCYGTGFEGGYDVFPRILLRFYPAGQKIQLTDVGLVVDGSPRGHTPIVPILASRDIIVRSMPTGILSAYEITNPTRTTKEGMGAVPTIQEFSLKLHEDAAHNPIYQAVSELVESQFKPVETATEPGLPRETG